MLITLDLCSTEKMTTLFNFFRLFTAISFIGYGLSCFFSPRMVIEFNRYGLGRQRKVIGILQIAGSVGMLLGFYFAPLILISSLGFSLMMLLAVVVRLKIKDPVIAAAPAILYFGINFFILLYSLKLMALS